MEKIQDYKELNKPIIAKIMKTLEKFPDPEVQAKGIEILIEYDDRGLSSTTSQDIGKTIQDIGLAL